MPGNQALLADGVVIVYARDMWVTRSIRHFQL